MPSPAGHGQNHGSIGLWTLGYLPGRCLFFFVFCIFAMGERFGLLYEQNNASPSTAAGAEGRRGKVVFSALRGGARLVPRWHAFLLGTFCVFLRGAVAFI